jgi:hypothetical protein
MQGSGTPPTGPAATEAPGGFPVMAKNTRHPPQAEAVAQPVEDEDARMDERWYFSSKKDHQTVMQDTVTSRRRSLGCPPLLPSALTLAAPQRVPEMPDARPLNTV